VEDNWRRGERRGRKEERRRGEEEGCAWNVTRLGSSSGIQVMGEDGGRDVEARADGS
jgi:predicted transposase YdaD